MRVVAVDAGRVPVIVEDRTLGAIMNIVPSREGGPRFGKLDEAVGGRRRDVRSAVVTCKACLLVVTPKQPRRAGSIMRHMATRTGIAGHRAVSANVGLI